MSSMKIVVRAPNWLGDVVLSLPALKSLKKNFPQADIWIAVRERLQDLYAHFDFIKGVIPLPELIRFKDLKNSARRIREYNFDIGLLLTNSFSSAFLFFLAKIPQRWGYIRDYRRFFLTKGVDVNESDNSFHQVVYYLNLLVGLGLQTSPPELVLPLSSEEKNWANKKLQSFGYNPSNPLVIFSPGAFYGPAKRWPSSKFARLGSMLQEKKGAEIFIQGSAEETELAETVALSMTKKPKNITGVTLRQLAGITSCANLFITNDTGPMHLANALRIPVVAVFGPTDPSITGPFHQPSVVIKKDVPCWPCKYRICPFDHRCMNEIEPEEVFRASQNFI